MFSYAVELVAGRCIFQISLRFFVCTSSPSWFRIVYLTAKGTKDGLSEEEFFCIFVADLCFYLVIQICITQEKIEIVVVGVDPEHVDQEVAPKKKAGFVASVQDCFKGLVEASCHAPAGDIGKDVGICFDEFEDGLTPGGFPGFLAAEVGKVELQVEVVRVGEYLTPAL